MLSRAFVHDANQCLHVIRLAAEAMALESKEGRLSPERLDKRVDAILGQVEHLTTLIGGMAEPAPLPLPSAPFVTAPLQDADLAAPMILVVEDEVLAALMLADDLQQRGFDVRVAHDGREAADLCHATIFDAIVTDIRMPRMDGIELLRELDQLQPETPVIVVSGHLPPDQVALLPESVVEVLRKPFAPAQVANILAKVLPVPQLQGGS